MGNETSQLSGLEIDEKAVEVTDFWTHHSAVLHSENVTPLSVFIGEPLVGGTLWINQTPLEKATKNLMLHRHPCILKYISSWNKSSKLYLAVEYVKPLAHVISNQTTLQICIGLHSILKAITFLHENALSSHNNICSACIYVTQDGSWKLGGLEYLCRFKDLNLDYLAKTRSHRYEKAIDPNEEKNSKDPEYFKNGAIDKYAFAVLVDQVLRKKTNKDIPCLEEFRLFCKNELQNQNPTKRPNFSAVLKHEFFTHNFITIYSFLTELPLKLENERQEFFANLATKLHTFPEEIVARQLGELLLSRLVLLDRTARSLLLPFVLIPKQENSLDNDQQLYIFSENTYKQIIIPKLLHIFRVRDAQIRLLLLSHFKNFVMYFTKEQLQNHILPELLLGIKDTNDHLVSVTLVALSDLVPILGAATVIGGKRAKLFNDGRPAAAAHSTNKKFQCKKYPSRRNSNSLNETSLSVNSVNISSSSSNNVTSSLELNDLNSTAANSSSELYLNQMLELPERPSPDGGEEEISTTEQDQSAEDDLENWSDWEINDNSNINTNLNVSSDNDPETMSNQYFTPQLIDNNPLLMNDVQSDTSSILHSNNLEENISLNNSTSATTICTTTVVNSVSNKPTTLPDISELDIKNQTNIQKEKTDEFDFFQDMEPVIEMTNIILIDNNNTNRNNNVISEKCIERKSSTSLNLNLNHQHNDDTEEGWGDDLDWVEN